MELQVLTKSEILNDVYEGINRALSVTEPSVCGLIMASCTLKEELLERLETHIAEDAKHVQFLYEQQTGVLAVVCAGMQLSRTHFIALEAKKFLHSATGHEVGMLISSFTGAAGPDLQEIEDMLQKLLNEAAEDKKIHVYKSRRKGKKHPTVLIIDEDATGGEFLNNLLQMKGYEVYQAYDGLQGIRLYEKLSPDVVITELTLPVYDGYQVIRKLQQNDKVDSKIVVLSERRLEQDVSACFKMGVADYVKKPYSPVELEARLRRLLS
jgi:CheY-like chemotaxis protein